MTRQDTESALPIGPKFIETVMTALQDDIVSFAELQQLVRDTSEGTLNADNVRSALEALLGAGVQIGQAFNDRGEHVRFVAWCGNADERIRRAERVLEEAQGQDRGFAVWLCLESKIDEYEGGSK